MKAILRKNIYLIFFAIVSLNIIGLGFDITSLYFLFKPLLIPTLIIAVLLLSKENPGRIKILLALLFSFVGDVLLLFEARNPLFFIIGLVCFLLTHIFYIVYFIQLRKPETSAIKKYPYLILPILLYTGSLLYLLLPHLGNLKIPVIIYACVISTMLYFSLSLPFSIPASVRYLFMAGALFFVLSDSLLAIAKFYKPFSMAPVLIILTYCLAQYLIVKAFIKNTH